LHRKYLKDVLGIDTLAQLNDVWSASQSIVSRIRIFPITDRNRKLIEQNHRQRVEAMRLTPLTDYDRPERKRYKRSYKAMVKSERVKDLKEMHRKHQAMRDGQTDELEREAAARFAPLQAKPRYDD